MAIWCEPEFFVRGATYISGFAKNSGWQIALIFCFFFIKEKEKEKSLVNS